MFQEPAPPSIRVRFVEKEGRPAAARSYQEPAPDAIRVRFVEKEGRPAAARRYQEPAPDAIHRVRFEEREQEERPGVGLRPVLKIGLEQFATAFMRKNCIDSEVFRHPVTGEYLRPRCRTPPARPASPDTQRENRAAWRITRPRISYILLIAIAIKTSPRQKCSLQEIYTFFVSYSPYFKRCGVNWKNSVRHCLSFNDCFIREPLPGKKIYSLWRLHDSAERMFESGNTMRRAKVFYVKMRPKRGFRFVRKTPPAETANEDCDSSDEVCPVCLSKNMCPLCSSENTSQSSSENTSQSSSENTSQSSSENTSQSLSENTSQSLSENTSQSLSENTSQNFAAPEMSQSFAPPDVSQNSSLFVGTVFPDKSQNVSVGESFPNTECLPVHVNHASFYDNGDVDSEYFQAVTSPSFLMPESDFSIFDSYALPLQTPDPDIPTFQSL